MFRASRGNILIHWDVTAEYINPIKCTKARKNNTYSSGDNKLPEQDQTCLEQKIVRLNKNNTDS